LLVCSEFRVSAVVDEELARLRREYADQGLAESDVDADPIVQFATWLRDAVDAGIHEPNAMLLATASVPSVPSARMVLLKGFDARGFVFFTNYESRKAVELDTNPRCALVLPWHPLQRQVRIEGAAQRVDAEESDDYFAVRPRGAQLGAWASPQSKAVSDRGALERRYAAAAQRFGDGVAVTRPPYWGGYRVVPSMVEFWQGRPGRMHDRLRYRRTDTDWTLDRLAP
jgi:pyridoxamine 5'-phosphate oxidase